MSSDPLERDIGVAAGDQEEPDGQVDITARDTANTIVLHCATLVVLALSFLSTSLGLGYANDGWWRDAAVGSGVLFAAWGLWLGLGEVRRLVRRHRLRERLQPVLADRTRYLAGHPALPRSRRLTILLTHDALLLDDDWQTLRLPLATFRQSLAPDPQTGRGRPWLVARNDYRNPSDRRERLAVEFLDDDIPRRVAFTDFRRTQPEEWAKAIDAACEKVLQDASPAASERTPRPHFASLPE